MSSDDRDDRTPDLARLTDEAKREFEALKASAKERKTAISQKIEALS